MDQFLYFNVLLDVWYILQGEEEDEWEYCMIYLFLWEYLWWKRGCSVLQVYYRLIEGIWLSFNGVYCRC